MWFVPKSRLNLIINNQKVVSNLSSSVYNDIESEKN